MTVTSKSFILINIGNTNTNIYSSDGLELFDHQKVSTEVFLARRNLYDITVIVSSVVKEFLHSIIADNIFVVDCEKNLGFTIDSDIGIETVGADRLANLAFLAVSKLPAISIDIGTAITYEILDENATLVGGGIAPGRKLMSKGLNIGTSLLPEVELNNELNILAKTTNTAIISGINHMVLGFVELLIRELLEQYPEATFYLAGGDTSWLLPKLKEYPIRYEPDMTLKGMLRVYYLNTKENK
jgi:type III pantothenate kinase